MPAAYWALVPIATSVVSGNRDSDIVIFSQSPADCVDSIFDSLTYGRLSLTSSAPAALRLVSIKYGRTMVSSALGHL